MKPLDISPDFTIEDIHKIGTAAEYPVSFTARFQPLETTEVEFQMVPSTSNITRFFSFFMVSILSVPVPLVKRKPPVFLSLLCKKLKVNLKLPLPFL